MKHFIFFLLLLPVLCFSQTQWVDATGDTIRVVKKTGTRTFSTTGVVAVKDSTVIIKVPVVGTLNVAVNYTYDTVVVLKKQSTPVPPPVPPPTTGSTFTFNAVQKSFANVAVPGGKLESWSEQWITNPGYSQKDGYFRFSWSMLEGGKDQYLFDAAFKKQAEMVFARGGRFSFGIMTHYPDAVSPHRLNYDGGYSVYPEYLHKMMQAESVKDWRASNGAWVPNWNSEAYLTRLLALHKALDKYIKEKGWAERISYVDVRGYGAFGEWHSYTIADQMNQYPAGTRATETTLKRIIDIHTEGFPDFPLVTLVSTFDANRLGNTMNPPGVAYHALTTSNRWGKLGWRRDNWGATDDYLRQYTTGNTYTFNGMRFDTAIMNRWKYAPVVGEPCCGDANNYNSLVSQVKAAGATSIGNGNIYSLNATKRANLIAAGEAAGSRLTIDSAWYKDGQLFIRWFNAGISPLYEKFNVLVKVGSSSFTTPLANVLPGHSTQSLQVSGKGVVTIEVKNDYRSYPLGISSNQIGEIK